MVAFVAVKANSMEPTYDSNNKYNTLNSDIKGTFVIGCITINERMYCI